MTVGEDPENRAPRVSGSDVSDSGSKSSRGEVDPRVRKAEASLWWFFGG